MYTVIDNSLLNHFFESRPREVPFGELQEYELWLSFWKFLQKGTDLEISNFSNNQNLFLTQLTSGRGNTKIIQKTEPFKAPYKNEIKNVSINSFFCLNFEDEQIHKKYIKNNGYLIAAKHNYLDKWKDLSLFEKKITLSVRPNSNSKENTFDSWSNISEYLTPFTDIVIVDNYILDETLLPYNLEKMLVEFDQATPVKYNLTIYTYEGHKLKIDGKSEFDRLLEIKQRNQLKFNLQLVIAYGQKKEHDRSVFTNYLRIKSGDSFNYFDSKNEIITKGTEIDFISMADPLQLEAANLILKKIAVKIEEIKEDKKMAETHIFGNCKNRLLNNL